MPHLAAAAINAWLSGHGLGIPATQPALDATQRAIIAPALTQDAHGMLYSAAVTVVDALNGISRGFFSWGTVKLYYASFYAARVLLAANDVAIFYPNRTPHSLRVLAGERAKKEKGVTHKVIWDVLKDQLPNSALLAAIDGRPASEWMMSLREEANYRTPKFPDPTVPTQFAALDTLGFDKALRAYASDMSYLYSFDPDHAALAFPIECLRAAAAALGRTAAPLDDVDRAHIERCLADLGINPAYFLRVF